MPHLWPTGSSSGSPPSTAARYFSSCPSDPTSRWTPCPPESSDRWLQVRLGCVRLSPSCPCRLLHTFRPLRPARHYPRLWIRRPSSGRRRDFNPPDQRAAQRTLCPLLTSAPRSASLAARSVPILCGTRRRPPEVIPTAFRARPPDLRSAPLMDVDFAVTCPLVRRSRLRSGSCPSARAFAPRFFQTPPRGDALALRYPFASIRLGRGLSPPNCRSCSAHKAGPSRGKPSEGSFLI